MDLMVEPKKLIEHIETAINKQEPFRRNRTQAMKNYVGRWYSADDGLKRPLNLVFHTIATMLPQLVPPEVGYEIESYQMPLRFEGERLALMMKHLAREIELGPTLRDCVVDACLGPFGIVKCGVRSGADMVKIQDRFYNRGQFYCRRVDFDDYVADPSARCEEELYWEGHRFRAPRKILLESGIFDEDRIKRLPSVSQERYPNEDFTEELSAGREQFYDRFALLDIIELYDIAVYEADGTTWIVTLPSNPGYADDYLYQERFEGPEKGPYTKLGFYNVPNNFFPLPLVSAWHDLAEALNVVALKVMENAASAKSILAYSRTAQDAALEIKEAPDREAVAVDDVNQLSTLEIGGLHQAFLPFMATGMGWWDMISGNVNLQGGTAPKTDTKTLGEAKILQAGSTVRTQDLIRTVYIFKRAIGRQMLWELTHDPLIRKGMSMRIPGGEFVEVEYSAEAREGDFWEFNLKVIPTVPENHDPSVRARRLNEFFSIVPTLVAAHMQTQGMVDFPSAVRVWGRLNGFPELDEIARDPKIQQEEQQLYAGIAPPQQGRALGPTRGLNQGAVVNRAPSGDDDGSGVDGRLSTGRNPSGRMAPTQGPGQGLTQPQPA